VPGEEEINMADLSVSGDTLAFHVREPRSGGQSTAYYHQGSTITSTLSVGRMSFAAWAQN